MIPVNKSDGKSSKGEEVPHDNSLLRIDCPFFPITTVPFVRLIWLAIK